jgi:hypothetical protein
MFNRAALLAFSFAAVAYGQQVGTNTAETHPPMTWAQCSGSSCTSQSSAVVLDSNWRWLHTTTGFTNCYTGNAWNTTLCPDDVTCAANCALDGADYSGKSCNGIMPNQINLIIISPRHLRYHHQRKCPHSQVRDHGFAEEHWLPCLPHGPRQHHQLPDVQAQRNGVHIRR